MKTSILALACLALGITSASATTIFSSGLEDGTGWTVTENGDTSSQFGFDYSALGIPSAPNGTGTSGARLAANISADAPGGGSAVAISPGVSVSGKYTFQFDFWFNYHINGSTEEGGGSVGFDPSGGNPLGGSSFLANTDGDSGTDYKLYNAGSLVGAGSPFYNIPSLNHSDASNTALQAAFLPQTAPDAQGTGYTNTLGGLAFQWHTMLVNVDSDAQTANFSVDGFDFGTLSGEDYTGDVALVFTDPFNSVAGNSDLAFGVFDNVIITQVPEPSAALLLSFGVGLVAFRRRR